MSAQRSETVILVPSALRRGDVVLFVDVVLGARSVTVLTNPISYFGGRRVGARVRDAGGRVTRMTWGTHERLRVLRGASATARSPEPPRHAVAQVCPLCDGAILERQPVFFDRGDVVHVSCARGASDLSDLIVALLTSMPGFQTCHQCLARHLAIRPDEARKATMGLRVTPGYTFSLGATCQSCGKPRVTIVYNGEVSAG